MAKSLLVQRIDFIAEIKDAFVELISFKNGEKVIVAVELIAHRKRGIYKPLDCLMAGFPRIMESIFLYREYFF